ncbi:PD40 domain-containing protein [Mucilaginibacter sp. SP1R1]|uniref:PD40 domain-containing protein n=1 Tax=Mucilaginibacter sp. SP1R1 TaxID=2723091 RepID=UPI00161D8CFF|nr:PD40 domain-containing protein [Mucilaginibacter sp. SP1R1]MBB6151376.1 Tol biopolymer transport system component [Mucilaginibacter sp. SP1R1]
MKAILKSLQLLIFTFCLLPFLSSAQNTNTNYIDSSAKAQVFAPDVVSSPYTEWATSFTPDGKTVYFSRGSIFWTIVFSKNTGDNWTEPQVASFSGKWNDTDPFISPDGKKLFFISNRPLANADQSKFNSQYHIWYVDQHTNGEWGSPQHVSNPVNIDSSSNYGVSVSNKGTLYWCSRDREGHKGMQSYYANWLGNHYDSPQLLTIKGVDEIQDPFIAPDERYLVFLSGNDIYISLRQENGWAMAQKLSAQVNNGDSNSSPCISPDGKTLYYSSSRIVGFYKRDRKNHTLNFSELQRENGSLFNGQPNILMIPIHLPKG